MVTRRAATDLRVELEVVHQPARAGKSEPEAVLRRVAVAHRELFVVDARSLIDRDDLDADASRRRRRCSSTISPSLRVDDDVARDLRDRRRDQRLIGRRESELRRELPAGLTRQHDVRSRARSGLAPSLTAAPASFAASSARPSSRSSAVETPSIVRPSWTIANATSGWIPTITVSVTIMLALEHWRHLSSRWGWMLASGLVDLSLAVFIVVGLPATASWALGLILAVNMIFGGGAMIGMALAARDR